VSQEVDRRLRLDVTSAERSAAIREAYRPLHPQVYNLQERYLAPRFRQIVQYCQRTDATKEGLLAFLEEAAVGVYRFPVFEKSFCEQLLEELEHFEQSSAPKGRPNTMNRHGVLLNELGLDEGFITPLREHYLQPVSALLYPECGGGRLDSHKAFVVKYDMKEDVELSYHYDNAEVTLNASIGKEFTDGNLYFGALKQVSQEVDRRLRLDVTSAERSAAIREAYRPLHPQVYNLQERYLAPRFRQIVQYCQRMDATKEGLLAFLEEAAGELDGQARWHRAQARGLRHEGSGSRAQARGLRLEGSGSRAQARGSRLEGPGSRAQARGLRHEGPGTRAQARGLRLEGSGSRAQARGLRLEGPGVADVVPAVYRNIFPPFGAVGVYRFPVFEKSFCEQLLEELEHFEQSSAPKGRPNTMNRHGVLLNELGLDEGFITPLREHYLQPVSALLYPECGGGRLDSHKAFVVKYDMKEDVELSYHYDNAEVTLNASIGKEFTDGNLYFGALKQVPLGEAECSEVEHRVSEGLLHRGQHMHGALPISSGQRWNLIVWMRASQERNGLCPMCNRRPLLVEGQGFADGFTRGAEASADWSCVLT
ncbi:unnamed protein product, partial [Tetraodon nigroviridis]